MIATKLWEKLQSHFNTFQNGGQLKYFLSNFTKPVAKSKYLRKVCFKWHGEFKNTCLSKCVRKQPIYDNF